MRDTVFLGPLLVIPFNWVFAHLLVAYLPPDLVLVRYLLLFAMWPPRRSPCCCSFRALQPISIVVPPASPTR